MIGISIESIASQLGSKRIKYSDFQKVNPDWNMDLVFNKTGIEQIFHTDENENVNTLSIESSKKTIKNFNSDLIDGLIVVTQTSINKLPSLSCIIQENLGLKKNILSFDINLGCSGFVYALATCYSLISSGILSNILLISCDNYSKYLSNENRSCLTLFSDASASCIIRKSQVQELPSFSFYTDGSGADHLKEENNYITMNGPEIFFFSINQIPNFILSALGKSKKTISDIDHFIFHQASKIVIDSIIRKTQIPKEKIHINYNKIGNTTSSSIPILLNSLILENKIKKKENIMFVGFGVGLSAASCIMEW